MAELCVEGAIAFWNHNGGVHIIGWTGGDSPQPIYCSSFNVQGIIDQPGQNVLYIEGKKAFVSIGSGYYNDNDGCPNSRVLVTPITYSQKMFVKGNPVILVGNQVIMNHSSEIGVMSIPNQSKFYVAR